MVNSNDYNRNLRFAELCDLSRELGKPENDYVIQAEGNTSVRIDADTFWVKASGFSLRDVDENGFVAMCFDPVLELLDGPDLPDERLKMALNEQVVVCGPHLLYVPYADPGLPLAREVRQRFLAFIDKYGEPPKEVLMQSHGLIALGQSCTEVERITAMSVKAARILLGTYALGGPRFLSEHDVMHLWERPDEITRRARLIGNPIRS